MFLSGLQDYVLVCNVGHIKLCPFLNFLLLIIHNLCSILFSSIIHTSADDGLSKLKIKMFRYCRCVVVIGN
jgi:hypothetical protein